MKGEINLKLSLSFDWSASRTARGASSTTLYHLITSHHVGRHIISLGSSMLLIGRILLRERFDAAVTAI